jgi:uncharacterized protein (UPF0332 family)
MVRILNRKTRTTLEDCISKGLIEKTLPSQKRAELSLGYAMDILEEAKATLNHKHLHAAIALSYQAAFHASRSLLDADGWREKSHVCVARYLEERYVKHGKLEKSVPAMLERMRGIRHNNQYNPSFIATEADASEMIKSASSIVIAIRNIIKSGKK